MCTCINYKNNDFYFGRNLDLEYSFNEKVVITPRNYLFKLKNKKEFKTKYAIIGMATVIDNYPLYAEGCNEKGLCIAGLYFPDNAYFNEEKNDKINITQFELIPWLLGNFKTINEIKRIINKMNIINTNFKDNLPLVPLHWMISDDKECFVIEQTKSGLNIYKNEIGVLTNNPQFYYHITNLNNYVNLSNKNPSNNFSNKIKLKTYGQGMGAIGLPGDNSSVSRFVRVTFNKFNSVSDDTEKSNITQFFHILDSVFMIKGTTLTNEGEYDITRYSCCINASKCIYYYKTYNNNQISAIKINKKNKNNKNLTIYNLINLQQINYIN